MTDPAHIAFNHDSELLDARWGLDEGRTVSFRIAGEAFERIHPFKRFTQRRGGRAGTRFAASIADVALGVMRFHGDAMLAAWGDSSTTGQSFKLWLDDESAPHPFAGFNRRKGQVPGDLFAVVLVEIDDDETPLDQDARARLEGGTPHPVESPSGAEGVQKSPKPKAQRKPPEPKPRKAAKLSSSVHLMVTGPMYLRWLQETRPKLVPEWTGDLAKAFTKHVLGIESLSDLDRNPEAVKLFHEKIRRPFEKWHSQEPGDHP